MGIIETILAFLTGGTALVILGFIIALVVIFVAMARVLRFIRKVPPNMALLVYGVKTKTKVMVIRRVRKLKHPLEESELSSESPELNEQEWETETTSEEITVNYRIIKGGMTIVLPVIHEVKYLDLSLQTLDVAVHNVLSVNAVPITVDGIAQIKIGSDDTSIATAAEQLLDKTDEEVRYVAIQTLQGHLRAIIGLMTVEEVYRDREAFAQRVLEVAVDDLAGMGLQIVSFVIKEINDEKGYLEALGRPEIAVKLRDARRAEASADQSAFEREQEAEKEKAGYAKEANVAKAKFDAETDRERAVAEKAKAISLAEQDRTLEEKQAIAAEQAAIRRDKQLDAEKRRPADAERYSIEQQAEATKFRGYTEADVKQKTGEAEAAANKAKGLAAADVTKAELTAEADGDRAKRLAVADGTKAQGEAEGTAILAKLMAEAEGKRELAESLNAYRAGALRLVLGQTLLEKVPEVAQAFGEAFANIEQIRLIEIGGGAPGEAGEGIVGSTERFLDMIPNTLFKFLQGTTALIGSPIDDLIAATIIEEAEKRGIKVTDERREAVKEAVAKKAAEAEAEDVEAPAKIEEVEAPPPPRKKRSVRKKR